MEPISALGVTVIEPRTKLMQAAVDRVMQAYGLMVSLSEAGQKEVRERVEAHLAGVKGDDRALAVEGLRYLRNAPHSTERGTAAVGA